MAFTNIKQGNKTIMAISFFVLLLVGFLALGSFGIIPTGFKIFTPLGAGLITFFVAIILLLETYFEGAMPNLKKDTGALINTIFAGAAIIFGIIILIGKPVLTGAWLGVVGVVYSITFILIAKELIFD